MRERLNWLDSMRGLAFLMVIYYHLSTRSAGGIVPYFTPVFLTAFFFVSGYLTKSGMPFGKVLEQRTRTLFVPLLIFGLGGYYYFGKNEPGGGHGRNSRSIQRGVLPVW